MRVLIDTNVFLDYVLERHPFHAKAEDIILRLANEEFVGYVSAITPVNVYYFGRKMKDREHARLEVRRLVRLVEIAQTDKNVLQTAFTLDFTDYEDAVQCASAIAEGLDAIVTRNTKDFEKSPIPVYSPAEFLTSLLNK
ncbi:MAG: PIN domain-containing protein [Pyrinomonadaceae bacterium]